MINIRVIPFIYSRCKVFLGIKKDRKTKRWFLFVLNAFHLWNSSSNGNSQFENEAARVCKDPTAHFMAGSVVVFDILTVMVRYHAIIGIKHDGVCIVGVKLLRVPSWSPGAARQHPQEFDTNNTHTIMFEPLNNMCACTIHQVKVTPFQPGCVRFVDKIWHSILVQ